MIRKGLVCRDDLSVIDRAAPWRDSLHLASLSVMTYPAAFHRLVIIGNLYSEKFNTTLAMIPTGGGALPAVSDTLLAAVGTFVGTWFPRALGGTNNNGIGIISSASLTSVKLNRIGSDGKYVNADAKEHVYGTPIAGGYATVVQPQLTVAATLRGLNERARGGRGRMYPPPSQACGQIQTDGRITAAVALQHAKGITALIAGLNDVYLTAGVSAVAGIASHQGAGAFQSVAQVSVGRVVDTIRSRRTSLAEDPQYWGMP